MSKKGINLSALKPIMNILDMRMTKELSTFDCSATQKALKKIQEDNEKGMYKIFDHHKAIINKAIKDFNLDLVAFNVSIGDGNAFKEISEVGKPYASCSYKLVTGPKPYDYDTYNITHIQGKDIVIKHDASIEDIKMKYENIKAKIMLADDYDSIKEILTSYNISLENTADVADKL